MYFNILWQGLEVSDTGRSYCFIPQMIFYFKTKLFSDVDWCESSSKCNDLPLGWWSSDRGSCSKRELKWVEWDCVLFDKLWFGFCSVIHQPIMPDHESPRVCECICMWGTGVQMGSYHCLKTSNISFAVGFKVRLEEETCFWCFLWETLPWSNHPCIYRAKIFW